MVAATVSTAQAGRVAGTATAAAPEVVDRCLGAAGDGLIGQSGSGQGRHRDSREKRISQKYSHLNSPWLSSVYGHVSLAGTIWFMENAKFVEVS
jgi:hypothetical protein